MRATQSTIFNSVCIKLSTKNLEKGVNLEFILFVVQFKIVAKYSGFFLM